MELASEYERIQKRATEDPGTAGDQGEENWAGILREWLPPGYHIETKGRLINEYGERSPQIDVIVLKPSYPKKLYTTKLYLAAGVAAVFECKNTLKTDHIRRAVETCAKIKSLFKPRLGSPYRELHAPIIFGLLAHSHSWKSEKSKPIENIEDTLVEASSEYAIHPRLEVDLLCVADLQSWHRFCSTYHGPHYRPWDEGMAERYGPDGSAGTGYMSHIPSINIIDDEKIRDLSKKYQSYYSAVGDFLKDLYKKMAWEDPSMRDLAYYFQVALHQGGAGGSKSWPSDIYSETIRDKIVRGIGVVNGGHWNEWTMHF